MQALGNIKRRNNCQCVSLVMSTSSTPSAWIVQSLDTEELSQEDLEILISELFIDSNVEKRDEDCVTLKISYRIKWENILEKLGAYKDSVQVVPISPHHSAAQLRRFLELVARKRVIFSTPDESHPEEGAASSEIDPVSNGF